MANASWFPSGGDWTYLNSICKTYEINGHNIIPFAMKDSRNFYSNFGKYFLENINYEELNKNKNFFNAIKVLKKSIYSLEAKSKLISLLNDNVIDIAQLNNIHNIHTPSIISVLKKRNIPIVWRVLDYKLICPNRTFLSGGDICQKCATNKYYNCILNKCKKNSLSASVLAAAESYFYELFPYKNQIDSFLFQNEFMKDLFLKYGFDKNKCYVLENPYDCSEVVPQYYGKDYALYFGRLSAEKGILTLLESMKCLKDIRLKIVGDGPLLNQALKYISVNNINNVEFLGPLYGDALDIVLKDALFTIVPSEWLEPSPYVVLQSYACGKAVLANDIGGLSNLVKDGITGRLSKIKDIDSLSGLIKMMYFNTENTKIMGINARKYLEDNFTSKRYYESSIKIFNSLTFN